MAGEQTLSGRDYILEIDITTPISEPKGLDYRPLLCEVVSSFGISTSDIAISNSCTGRWDTRIPNKSGFTFSGEWQAIDPSTGDPDAYTMNMIAYLAASRTMFWARRKLKGGAMGVEIYREGVVWINNYEDSAGADDPFTFTADFIGVGAPTLDGGYGVIGLLADSRKVPIVTGDDAFILVKAGSGLNGDVPEETTLGLALGDSTIAAGSGKGDGVADRVLTAEEEARGYELRSIAVAGDTIQEQKDLWDALTNRNDYDYVVMQIGLNDIGPKTSAAVIDELQGLVNHIKNTGRPGVAVIVSAMIPIYNHLLTEPDPAGNLAKWQAVNQAIATTITGVLGRVTAHVARMSDGNSAMLPQYDSGDGLHENNAGADVIAEEWRAELIRLNLIK